MQKCEIQTCAHSVISLVPRRAWERGYSVIQFEMDTLNKHVYVLVCCNYLVQKCTCMVLTFSLIPTSACSPQDVPRLSAQLKTEYKVFNVVYCAGIHHCVLNLVSLEEQL